MRGGGKYPVHDLTTAIMYAAMHPQQHTQERKRLRIFAGQDRTRVEHPIHSNDSRGNRYIPLVVSYLQLSIIYSCCAGRDFLTLHPKHIQYIPTVTSTNTHHWAPSFRGHILCCRGASPTWVPLQGKWHVPALFVYYE